MDQRIRFWKHRLASVCLAVACLLPLRALSQGSALRSDVGVWPRTNANNVNVSNVVCSANASSVIQFGAGIFCGGSNAVWVPQGVTINGLGSTATEIDMYNNSTDLTTNGGAFYLPDNSSVSSLFLNQTQYEQFVLAPIGSQRKNQTSPAQTAGNLAATSTNVLLDGVKVFGAKLHAVIADATNTMRWKIRNSVLIAAGTTPLSWGTTPGGSGEVSGFTPVTETNSLLEISNTRLEVTTGNATPRGLYISRPGQVFASIGPIILNRANSGTTASAVEVAATNCMLDLTIVGGVSYAFGTANTAELRITGSTNTVIIRGGVTNVVDSGTGNTIIWDHSYTPSFVKILATTANTTLLSSDSGTWVNNNGASAPITNTLPAAIGGLHYGLTVVTANTNLAFKAVGSDTIASGASVSAAAGLIFSTNSNAAVHLYCPVAGKWIVDYATSTWTVQ